MIEYGTDKRATSLVDYLATDEGTPEDRWPLAPDEPLAAASGKRQETFS